MGTPPVEEAGIAPILIESGNKAGAILLEASGGGLKGSLELKIASGTVSE